MKRESHLIFIRPLKRATLASWCLVLMISLTWQHSHSAVPQAQDQVDLSGKNVLVLHAWEANLPMSTETNKALSRVFSSGGIPAFNQSFECLDLRRNPGPEYKKLLAEKMRLQYGHRKPDLIIAVNPIAMRFATDDCRDVFADIPSLALMLPTGFQVPKTSRRVISHFPSLDIVRTLDIALKLVPHAKRVYVASGSYETDIAFENQVRQVSEKWEGRLQFLYLSSPFVSMLSTYLRFPPERRVALIHGVRYSWDLGYRSILMAMEHLRTNFTYIPVVSRPKEEPVPWKGATGHVQDVWKSGTIEKAWGIRPGPENTHVFMCGSPRMSESMTAMLRQEGSKEDTKNEPGQIHVEKYWQ